MWCVTAVFGGTGGARREGGREADTEAVEAQQRQGEAQQSELFQHSTHSDLFVSESGAPEKRRDKR